jgi:hypothetical protein
METHEVLSLDLGVAGDGRAGKLAVLRGPAAGHVRLTLEGGQHAELDHDQAIRVAVAILEAARRWPGGPRDE